MKKTITILSISLLALVFATTVSADTATVVSDANVKIVGVYNLAGGLNNYVNLSGSPLNAVIALEPVNYPTTYASQPLNSVWDNGTGLYFQNTNPGADWIWETERAEGPANYNPADPLYDAAASTSGRVVVFEKEFNIDGTPQDSVLHIAADNGWEVFINGEYLARSATATDGWELSNLHESYLSTTGWQSVGHINVSADKLVSGKNTIMILAGNEYFASDDGNNPTPPLSLNPYYQYNPGALIFKMDVPYEPIDFCVIPQGSVFASQVIDTHQGLRKDGTPVLAVRSIPTQGLVLEYGNNASNFYSLGFNGWIIAGFNDIIVDGTGNDIKITEDTWGAYPLEQADIYVSQDGSAWTKIGTANNTNSVNATHTTSEFDLASTGWSWAKYVKVVDTTNPALFGPEGDGYDLNAIEALSAGCPLDVSKTAETSFDRTYEWTIDKYADQSALVSATGEIVPVNYTVKVDADYKDSNFSVSGIITIHNPNNAAVEISSVEDLVGAVSIEVDCDETLPYILQAGEDLECSYSADLTDNSQLVNTATVNEEFIGIANVIFGAPTTETDECVNVSDTYAGSLGAVCYADAPKTFTYSRNIGPYSVEGIYPVDNTASFIANDTSATGSDTWTITVTVPSLGCTLTQGYWKTHSSHGPASYDDTWVLLGENTTFFLSGQTYYEVLWTSPKGGNAYYQLAHQYIAAKLNMLNDASAPVEVANAISTAETLFGIYTPAAIGALKGGNSLRQQFISLAGIFGSYNEGLIGPGHCNE